MLLNPQKHNIEYKDPKTRELMQFVAKTEHVELLDQPLDGSDFFPLMCGSNYSSPSQSVA